MRIKTDISNSALEIIQPMPSGQSRGGKEIYQVEKLPNKVAYQPGQSRGGKEIYQVEKLPNKVAYQRSDSRSHTYFFIEAKIRAAKELGYTQARVNSKTMSIERAIALFESKKKAAIGAGQEAEQVSRLMLDQIKSHGLVLPPSPTNKMGSLAQLEDDLTKKLIDTYQENFTPGTDPFIAETKARNKLYAAGDRMIHARPEQREQIVAAMEKATDRLFALAHGEQALANAHTIRSKFGIQNLDENAIKADTNAFIDRVTPTNKIEARRSNSAEGYSLRQQSQTPLVLSPVVSLVGSSLAA